MQAMSYDDPHVRRGYIHGAKAACESLVFYIPTRERDALLAWIEQLENWSDGEPPVPPNAWEALLP